ncbi:ATP synthase F1 subunit delta [Spiroplasma endosymbiont of Aspidapion aeneum]|uniref:ATP synthase F1 subunit delta n=1 Tax=Spiroplasma endosymbiont of Aspidapion aeneum TaxID=3066276 RepID=UPI00313E50D0
MYELSYAIKNWAEAICLIAIEDKKEKEYIEYSEVILTIFRNYGNDLERILVKRKSHIDEMTIKFIDSSFGKYIKEKKLVNALKLIIDNNLIHFIKVIFKSVLKDLLLLQNRVEGTVFSTYELSKVDIKKIEDKISKKINLDVKLINVIDKSLIGGVAVKVQNYFIDGSIKGISHDLKKSVRTILDRK